MTKSPTRSALPLLTLLLGACGGSGSDTIDAGPGSAKGASNPTAESKPGAESKAVAASNLPAPATEADRYMVSYIETMDDIGSVLRGVHDEASAKAAGEKMKVLVGELQSKFDAASDLSEAEIGAASARYANAFQQVQGTFAQAMMPLSMKPELAKYVQDAMKDLPQAPKGK